MSGAVSVPFTQNHVGRGGWIIRASRCAGRALIVPACLVVIWTVVAHLTGPRAVTSPLATIQRLRADIAAGWLLSALSSTLVAALIAFVLGVGAGGVLGLLMAFSRFASDVVEAPLSWLYALPKIALFPVFVLLFGIGTKMQAAYGMAHGAIPVALFLLAGIRSLRPVYFRVALAYRLGVVEAIRRIILPGTTPSIMIGLRYCFSLSFIGVIVAEMLGGAEGIGQELSLAMRNPGTVGVADIYAIGLTLAIVALLANLILQTLERQIVKALRLGTGGREMQ
jgi:NitT/TauT family transport system permease protein